MIYHQGGAYPVPLFDREAFEATHNYEDDPEQDIWVENFSDTWHQDLKWVSDTHFVTHVVFIGGAWWHQIQSVYHLFEVDPTTLEVVLLDQALGINRSVADLYRYTLSPGWETLANYNTSLESFNPSLRLFGDGLLFSMIEATWMEIDEYNAYQAGGGTASSYGYETTRLSFEVVQVVGDRIHLRTSGQYSGLHDFVPEYVERGFHWDPSTHSGDDLVWTVVENRGWTVLPPRKFGNEWHIVILGHPRRSTRDNFTDLWSQGWDVLSVRVDDAGTFVGKTLKQLKLDPSPWDPARDEIETPIQFGEFADWHNGDIVYGIGWVKSSDVPGLAKSGRVLDTYSYDPVAGAVRVKSRDHLGDRYSENNPRCPSAVISHTPLTIATYHHDGPHWYARSLTIDVPSRSFQRTFNLNTAPDFSYRTFAGDHERTLYEVGDGWWATPYHPHYLLWRFDGEDLEFHHHKSVMGRYDSEYGVNFEAPSQIMLPNPRRTLGAEFLWLHPVSGVWVAPHYSDVFYNVCGQVAIYRLAKPPSVARQPRVTSTRFVEG